MAIYNPNNPFANMNAKWTGRPGYTDWGNLSPEMQASLSNWNGNYANSDVIWGMNPIKAGARQISGRTPYAVSDDLLNTIKAGGTSTQAYNAAKAAGKTGQGIGGMFSNCRQSRQSWRR